MEANAYFHSIFASRLTNSLGNLDDAVQVIQGEVYDYFPRTFGTIVTKRTTNYSQTYDELSIKHLKNALFNLKKSQLSTSTGEEIKYVSMLIRNKLKIN